MMRYTSINHCYGPGYSNYQIDHDSVASFEDWVKRHNVAWAKMFCTHSGKEVCLYTDEGGGFEEVNNEET